MLPERRSRLLTIGVVVLVLASTGGGLALLAVAGRLGARAVNPSELAVTIGLLGSLILWHRASNRIGLLLGVTGVLFGITVLAGGVLGCASARAGVPGVLRQSALVWAWLTQALSVTWVLFLLWFPDGQFLNRSWNRFFVASAVISLSVAAAGYLLSSPGGQLPALVPVARSPSSTGGPLAGGASSWVVYLSDVLSLAFPLVSLAGLM